MLKGVDSVQMASPAIDENIELSNRPINYLKGRIKALVKQEKQALMYLSTKGRLSTINSQISIRIWTSQPELLNKIPLSVKKLFLSAAISR